MRLRAGLQAKFLSIMGVAFLVVVALIALLLYRQERIQAEVVGVSRDAMRDSFVESLRRHGEGEVAQLAGSLTNPLYYFDLDAIGELSRAALANPGVRYVIVYDNDGNIVHDGSEEIPSYGKRMDDAMAKQVVAARALHTQWGESTFDVSMPIKIGQQRLGGVRVGYDLKAMRTYQDSALDQLRQRLEELGRRQLLWVGLLSVGLLALGALMVWLIQRWLVKPIRELADAAQAIENGQFDSAPPAGHPNDEVGDLMHAFSRMSHSLARHDRDIRRMAYTDALTGLANRLAFREWLDQRLLHLRGDGGQLGLLFADIDDFKRVNDTLGHDAGDDVLLQFAQRIQDTVRRIGGERALLARFGGDEFVILVEGSRERNGEARTVATHLAEVLVSELGQPIVVHDRQVFLGTSIGVTLYPEDASGATALMKNGDIAMYQAKVAGKNCYRFYSRAMDQAVERRVHLEHELRGAWDRGELSLVYQPVFRLADGKMVGAEALLRWKHPEQGLIAPSVFIDVAEQSGLIETLGPQVLRAACEDAVSWRDTRVGADPMFVSVNVSPRQLRSGDLPNVVAACLRETGLPAQQLHLELTETAVIGDEVHASSLLSRLRASGVKVWLDDFGTGFSGLSHLRRVPVDGVKIDRSFIADVLRDPDDLALTTAIIAMAHSLGIIVVAEGVEKEGQYAVLRERGCDLAQGYWLGHPVNAQEFLVLLA
ncbi:putative bifunctional diguanylate cyclase/phosphodiesterase [Lysobacter capsici]|jgi:diguanylate cyclase (GGDEF)-like protein|uniref:putative bifunctional diguanylate cyclase/phosphodiesterase n=1 Tax=Lysobacter capsici TaxID=435897 RepID=UPI00287B7A02|nr:EAL domain-containing protein [Lysobacter capsici]WND82236.1 EAL domain-containing protein [Lysobacter capsici]WND87431.1 EAL domain-containing protein [Lysobacter capsici]